MHLVACRVVEITFLEDHQVAFQEGLYHPLEAYQEEVLQSQVVVDFPSPVVVDFPSLVVEDCPFPVVADFPYPEEVDFPFLEEAAFHSLVAVAFQILVAAAFHSLEVVVLLRLVVAHQLVADFLLETKVC